MYAYDPTPERLSRVRAALDRALALDPQSPDAHLALGDYYAIVDQGPERVLEEYLSAARRRPNDSELATRIAWIRRSQGRFDEAMAELQRAFALDPRDVVLAEALGNTYRPLARYSEANRYYDIAIALAPDKSEAYAQKAAGYMEQGRMDRARVTLESSPEVDQFYFHNMWVDLERRTRNYQAALDRLAAVRTATMVIELGLGWKEVSEGFLYRLMKEPERARAAYEAAVAILEDAVAKHPENEWIAMRLAQAYAGLGRKADAVREADRVMAMSPVSRDAYGGTAVVVLVAGAYTTAGEHETALKLLESLASIPSFMSYGYLRYEPALDPLREYPRFQRLLADKKKQLRPSPD
jgi:serine/threonine-protein kinase